MLEIYNIIIIIIICTLLRPTFRGDFFYFCQKGYIDYYQLLTIKIVIILNMASDILSFGKMKVQLGKAIII